MHPRFREFRSTCPSDPRLARPAPRPDDLPERRPPPRTTQHGDDSARRGVESWGQVILDGARRGVESWGQVIPPSPVGGARQSRSSSGRPLSPSTSALIKLTAVEEAPLTDPRLANRNGFDHSSTIKEKKTPTWYRRVSVPRPELRSRQQIRLLELQLELEKEKNKGTRAFALQHID